MAPLEPIHWEAVTPEARRLVEILGELPVIRPFYLAGGTGLALRLGHRVSVDVDLFARIETISKRNLSCSSRWIGMK